MRVGHGAGLVGVGEGVGELLLEGAEDGVGVGTSSSSMAGLGRELVPAGAGLVSDGRREGRDGGADKAGSVGAGGVGTWASTGAHSHAASIALKAQNALALLSRGRTTVSPSRIGGGSLGTPGDPAFSSVGRRTYAFACTGSRGLELVQVTVGF